MEIIEPIFQNFFAQIFEYQSSQTREATTISNGP
jgi:hypothetical protein